MRTTDEQVNEVFRRACPASGPAPAAQENPAGRMLFRAFLPSDPSAERQNQHDGGNQYGDVRITCVRGNRQPLCLDRRRPFSCWASRPGWGFDAARPLVEKTKDRTLCSKMDGAGECFPSSVRGLTKGVGRVLFAAVSAPFVFRDQLTARIAFLLKKRYDETGVGFFVPQGRKRAEVRYGTQSEL